MNKRLWIAAGFAVVAAGGWPVLDVAVAQTLPPAAPVHNLSEIKPLPGAPNLNPTSRGRTAHIMPTVQGARALAKAFADTGPLLYNGGPIMRNPALYAIFWDPAALQNGGPTKFPVHNAIVNFGLLGNYPSHGIDNINTQYFQIVGSTTTYILNARQLRRLCYRYLALSSLRLH